MRRFILFLAALIHLAPALAGDAPLSFGILNQQSPALTAERWNPILQYVTAKTGVPLQMKMGKTVQETDAMMGRGEFDFMFTNHNFQSEYAGVGYKVIARWAGEAIHGMLAVTPDSPIQRLEDLAGKAVAYPSNDAFVAYAVPVVALKKAGVAVKEVFAGNQEGGLAQLKAHRVDAAAVNSRFLARYMEREKVQFRAIWTSEAYPDLAVIAHPRVDKDVVEKVRAALVGMKGDPAAASVLERAKSSGFEAASDRDYQGVRHVYKSIGQ